VRTHHNYAGLESRRALREQCSKPGNEIMMMMMMMMMLKKIIIRIIIIIKWVKNHVITRDIALN
jgi:hypothetical protein